MVEATDGRGFTLEALPALWVVAQVFRKDFDGAPTLPACVRDPIQFSHTARSELVGDLVWAESGSFRERHTVPRNVLSSPRRVG